MTFIKNTPSIESTTNNSVTPLNDGVTFVGIGELNNYQDVMIQVATDQNGVLYCEFSTDNVNWDTSLSFQYNTNRINPPHVFVKGVRYFRVRFENNSGSNQTYLRLNTYYGSFNKLTLQYFICLFGLGKQQNARCRHV